MKRVLYVHGFASSPHGRKVEKLRALLDHTEFHLVAPDMNVPSFRLLDFERMVEHAKAIARANPPAVIVGSSLGSLVALSVARERPGAPVVLIAPAFAIGERWLTKIPDGDPITVFHYGINAEAEIHRRFFEQMSGVTVDEEPPPSRVTVLMGRLDESIPVDLVERRWDDWVLSGRLVPGSRFVEIPDGDHGLVEFSDRIAEAIRESCQA